MHTSGTIPSLSSRRATPNPSKVQRPFPFFQKTDNRDFHIWTLGGSSPIHFVVIVFLANIRIGWTVSLCILRESGRLPSRHISESGNSCCPMAVLTSCAYCLPEELDFTTLPKTVQSGSRTNSTFGTFERLLLCTYCKYTGICRHCVKYYIVSISTTKCFQRCQSIQVQ